MSLILKGCLGPKVGRWGPFQDISVSLRCYNTSFRYLPLTRTEESRLKRTEVSLYPVTLRGKDVVRGSSDPLNRFLLSKSPRVVGPV